MLSLTEVTPREKSLLTGPELALGCLRTPTRINHTGTPDGFVEAYPFLLKSGCPPKLLNQVIDPQTGAFTFQVRKPYSFLDRDLTTLKAELTHDLVVPYQVAQISLDTVTEVGFNYHGIGHVVEVMEASEDIISLFDIQEDFSDFIKLFDSQEEAMDYLFKINVGFAMYHDIGNAFSRRGHSYTSVEEARLAHPGMLQDRIVGNFISDAIRLHDELAMKNEILSWGSDLTIDEIIALIPSRINPWARAGFIADKIQIRPSRVHELLNNTNAVDVDPHVEPNTLGRFRELRLSPDGKKAAMIIEFTPDATREHAGLGNLVRPASHQQGVDRVYASERMHELHSKRAIPIPYDHAYSAVVNTVYHERNLFTFLVMFGSFPDLETIYYVIQDPVSRGNQERDTQGKGILIHKAEVSLDTIAPRGDFIGKAISRDSLEEQFEMMRRKHVSKAGRKRARGSE